MTISEFLNVMNLTNITCIYVNKKLYSIQYLRHTLQNITIKSIMIQSHNKALTIEDIQLIFDVDIDPAKIELLIPESSQYIQLDLYITVDAVI